jgi:hypothetical protein
MENRPETLTYKTKEIEKLLSLLDSMQLRGLQQAQNALKIVGILQNPVEIGETGGTEESKSVSESDT